MSRGWSHVGGKKEISPPDVAWHKPLVEKISALESASPGRFGRSPGSKNRKSFFLGMGPEWVPGEIFETPLFPFNHSGHPGSGN